MTYLEKKEKEKYLVDLILKESLVCTKLIAEKLDCSRRTIERMISDLKTQGYDIRYSRGRGCYYLED